MARSILNVAIPPDVTPKIRDGVSLREADAHGWGSRLAVPPENKDRADNGDLSMTVMEDFDVRPLSHPGTPFKNLRSK